LTKIWGEVQQQVYQTEVNDVDELKQRQIGARDSLEQSVIDN